MTDHDATEAMARAFRETALSLIGLYQIYEADTELADATADTLGRLFRRHLRETPAADSTGLRSPLHALVDELDRLLGGAV